MFLCRGATLALGRSIGQSQAVCISRATARMKPASSRPTAMHTTIVFLPFALDVHYCLARRCCAFHAISRTLGGCLFEKIQLGPRKPFFGMTWSRGRRCRLRPGGRHLFGLLLVVFCAGTSPSVRFGWGAMLAHCVPRAKRGAEVYRSVGQVTVFSGPGWRRRLVRPRPCRSRRSWKR
jgi:hypothetical protein